MNTWPQGQPDYGIPDDPFHPPEETQQPRRRRAERRSEPVLPQGAEAVAPHERTRAEAGMALNPDPAAPRRRTRAYAGAMREADAVSPDGAVTQWQSVPDVRPRSAEAAAFEPKRAETRPIVGRTGPPVVTVTEDGSQFIPPVRAEIPDWLRTAQQINPPMRSRPPAPRVQAAPRQEYDDTPAYELPEMGSEPQAVQRTYRESARTEAAYVQTGSYAHLPEQQDEPRETESDVPEWVKRIPWLGIAAFLAVMAALVVWITCLSDETRTRQMLEERARLEQSLYERYPLRYQELIERKAERYNLSPAFVAAIMLNESSFRPDATSAVDARGLMQLMDDTASWIHDKLNPGTEYSFQNLYDPETNAEFGCWYLHFLAERFRGDPILVAAAFHAGQGEVQNWLNSSNYSVDHLTIRLESLPEGPTKQYVTRVLAAYAAYKRLYYGG